MRAAAQKRRECRGRMSAQGALHILLVRRSAAMLSNHQAYIQQPFVNAHCGIARPVCSTPASLVAGSTMCTSTTISFKTMIISLQLYAKGIPQTIPTGGCGMLHDLQCTHACIPHSVWHTPCASHAQGAPHTTCFCGYVSGMHECSHLLLLLPLLCLLHLHLDGPHKLLQLLPVNKKPWGAEEEHMMHKTNERE